MSNLQLNRYICYCGVVLATAVSACSGGEDGGGDDKGGAGGSAGKAGGTGGASTGGTPNGGAQPNGGATNAGTTSGMGGSAGSSGSGGGGTSASGDLLARKHRLAVNDSNGACAVAADRTVACWGAQGLVDAPSSADFDAVVARGSNFCGRKVDGSITCWGSFDAAPVGQYQDFSLGGDYGCALKQDNAAVECWKSTGGTIPEGAPTDAFTEIESGGSVVCARRADGALTCWGGPSELATPPQGLFAQVTVGLVHGCALDVSGAAQCWGSTNGNSRVPPNGQKLRQVAASSSATCGVLPAGSIGCWSDEGSGLVDIAGQFVEVAVGTAHACGVTDDATVLCAPVIPFQPENLVVLME